MSPQAEVVIARLERARRRWWGSSLAAGFALTAAASVAALTLFALLDALFHFSQRGLGILFAFWATFTALLAAAWVARAVRCRRGLAATARRVEMGFPELGSHLINLVQFGSRNGVADDPFRLAALQEAAEAAGAVPIEQAAARETRRRRFALGIQTPRDVAEATTVLAAVGLLAFLFGALIPSMPSAARRLMRPWTFVPTVGSVRIVKVAPGDTEVLIGSGLEVAAQVDANGKKAPEASLIIRPKGGGPETAVRMIPDASGHSFVAALPQVIGPLEYRLQVGDTQTRRYAVNVYERPVVTGVEVAFEYPPYLGLPRETRKQSHPDLEAPQYTRVALKVTPSSPIASGYLDVEGKRVEAQVAGNGTALLASLDLKGPAAYTIHLVTSTGHVDPEPRVNRIQVIPDAPPTVQLAEPGRETTVAAGARVPVVVRASDDHGLSLVRVETRVVEAAEGGSPGQGGTEPVTAIAWERFADPQAAVLLHQLPVDPAKVKAGQVLQVRAVARDRRVMDVPGLKLGPQETASAWCSIRVVAPEAKASADLARLDSLRAGVARILTEQIRARVLTIGLPKLPTRDGQAQLATTIAAGQVAIQKESVALVESVGPTYDEGALTVKKVVNKLAYGEMLQAVRQAETLGKAEALAHVETPLAELMATQDRVIDVLKRLLNELRQETTDLLADMKKRPGTELPPDVKDRLRALKDKLEEFLKAQKKVIDATEQLAKKPVDDFTEKDKQLLKELAASEDDWSRFMAETHSDLSKLPEQDFANPSALQELVEVQTELKMAKDALTKKTADIAVPLEQLGAEMAKEMTTNIEKWLPDTPDRERWSQEEPLTDDMKEAPMAELPKELEDIVGELMEGEEDLFDEMEDVSSSWADSLDKGAGWDAMDGPISNMSARGVTGNRLPNTSEISGRSGEGRSGKATGEFVSDTAVGKGGRKTPSRLTADAFVKGQVKDVSKDPVGGATGGGKESGQGGEGLQGPVRQQQAAREMARLASKQASLRNRAESVDLKFQVLRFHHTDLKSLIGQMGAVETDLKAGLYRNALRRRDVVLEGLGQVKMYVKGEFVIRQDKTANLPTEIQKEILGSMKEASPEGWDELNRQYFERLTASKATTASAVRMP